jgi:ParB family transcriptional regulator, chromosome partitioning protein
MAAKKNAAPKKARKKTPGKRAPKLTPAAIKRGLTASEVALGIDHPDIAPVVELVRKAGGAPLGAYREPLGGRPLLLASLPFGAVQPTPFQRDLSPTHAKRLAAAIAATAAFLDPLIVVRGEDGRFWTPTGRHRLAAAKVLGLKQITVLISPDETLSYRILALNTEKAHNLKDKSLEVVRMARNLAKREPNRTEASLAAEFEAAELLTLGLVYEENLRFGGGAYSPVLKKVDRLSTKKLPEGLRERAAYAARLQEIDNEVKRIVGELQARGMKSPYLRSYVVARINPVRFHKAKPGDKKPAMPIAQALLRMVAAARKFDLGKVNMSDLAFVAAGAESAE